LFSSRSNHATSLVRIAASQINYNDLVMWKYIDYSKKKCK
jgi:hypothetical protein